MENNLFNEKQIQYMYSDTGFFEFLNDYFSSYTTCIQNINYSISESEYSNWKIYIRIILANINELIEAINYFERHSSFSYKSVDKVYNGEIHGNLNINKYIKSKAKRMMPREYPCVIKTKSSLTPENILVIYIINKTNTTLNALLDFMKKNNNYSFSSEFEQLNSNIKALYSFTKKSYFSECTRASKSLYQQYGEELIKQLSSDILSRAKKGKIIKYENYKRIFNWYKTYQCNNLVKITDQNLKILRYNGDFSNKCFELWCLYKIKQTFIESFNAKLSVQNNVMNSSNSYIFKLDLVTGGNLEIYYQKGAGLYWTDQCNPSWKYTDNNQMLRGIPDITIQYKSVENSLIMIDIKNKIRFNRTNSEEIYKMIGYFDNFKKTFKQYNTDFIKDSFLIFRNDTSPFIENLENDEGKNIHILSVSPSINENLNDNQFKNLCRTVLNLQKMAGTTSEILSNYSHKPISSINSEDEFIKSSNENHKIIEHFFTNKVAKESLNEIKRVLRRNHFPHIWDKISDNTKDILAMSECLFEGVSPCDEADYAPICIEFCRALEVELNRILFIPFIDSVNIKILSKQNKFYQKLTLGRELTLGECIFMLEKCNHPKYPTIELKEFINLRIKKSKVLFDFGLTTLSFINLNIRRKSAHTSIMTYNDLLLTRQNILGIGYLNLLYVLLDDR